MAAPLEFGGIEDFQVDALTLFATLTDIDAVRDDIPDLVSSERIDDHTLRAVVRPGFSFLRGTMKLLIKLSDLQSPESAVMRVEASGIGVSMQIESRLSIERHGPHSKLQWRSTVSQLKGLIATVSPGLIKAAAEQIIENSWRQLRARLAK